MLACNPHTLFVDALHTLAVGVHQMRCWIIEGLQILIVKTWSLTQLAVPRLECCSSAFIVDNRINSCPHLVHLFVVRVFVGLQQCVWPEGGTCFHQLHRAIADTNRNISPTIFHEVFFGKTKRLQNREVRHPLALPPRFEAGEPLRVDWLVVAHIN